MDELPVLVAELAGGCICDPEPGDYELRVFCRVGDGEIALVVDEDTVPDDWDCVLECGCAYLDGKSVEVTITASGIYSALAGTYIATFNSSTCGFYLSNTVIVSSSPIRDFIRLVVSYSNLVGYEGVFGVGRYITNSIGICERVKTDFFPINTEENPVGLLLRYSGTADSSVGLGKSPPWVDFGDLECPGDGNAAIQWRFIDS
jgi:hypothetical protein